MMKPNGTKINAAKLLWVIFDLMLINAAWMFLVTCTSAKATFPAPPEVFRMLFSSFTEPIGTYTIWGHIAWSLYRVLVGFFLATVSGIIVGISMGSSKTAEAIIKPLFEFLRPIPPIAWIPLAILWFGIGEKSKYFIIWLGAFINVTLNAYEGAKRTDETLTGAACMLGADKIQVFTKIILPSSMPQIFAGLQVAMSSCWMAVLVAEMVRSTEGVGWIIIRGNDTGNTTQIIVGMITIGFIGFVLAAMMRELERRVCSWNTTL